MKQPEVQKWLRDNLPKLMDLMGLAEWENKIVFHGRQLEEDEEEKEEKKTSMVMDADPKYLKFTLHVYPKFYRRVREDPSNKLSYLVHELCHVILAENDALLDEYSSKNDQYHVSAISERATERFARAIVRAMKKGEWS